MRAGSVLFVGEGNLSFALTISRKPRVPRPSILATVYEAEEKLTDTAYENAKKLLNFGCSVKTGVDAMRLADSIGKLQFRTIIFQFPNVASRDPSYGQNPNHILVTRFLKNARNHLKPGGLVVISTVDSPFYEGAFKMDEAARKAGFAAPAIYTFDPKDYPGYTHQNTANEESAADGHTAFATFVFSG
jgi:predicted membrane-bound spermidine synthase